MNTINRFTAGTLAAVLVVGLSGCGDMSTRQKDTTVGAVGGAVAGAVLSGGVLGTAVGAGVGAVIGNEVGKGK